MPVLRPVWPPIERMMPSGRSCWITCPNKARERGVVEGPTTTTHRAARAKGARARAAHLLDVLDGDGQQVDLVRLLLAKLVNVGLDGRDVRVDEDDLQPLLLERLDRLRARVVKLARLADGEAARAEQEHLPVWGGGRR